MANGGRIDYTVGFKVDQSGLNQIKANLTSIQQGTTKDFVGLKGLQDADKKLIEIKKTASDVEAALNRSFNSNLGTLNISKFNQELKKLDIKKVYTDFSQLGPVGQNAFRNITSQILTTNLQLKQTNKWLDEMAVTMSNSIKWGVTSSIWNNMTGAVEKAWSFAKKLDTSLNDIRIVTEKSADDMERYAIAANKAAKNLGQTTTQYTNASLIYYQQGLSDAEVQARTETTLKAANVTGQSAAEVSEQLTAVWNGYKVSAQEAELYVDKLSAVAASTAADLEELSTGMSKVASAASLMGVDIDQLNAQLATVVSVTRQAPESVGTAFKTIYARMGDIEAGLDTETSLGEYTKKMNEMGFNVLDTNGKLKDMGSVIDEIGNKWTSLSREQQVALSQIMAGTRQYNNLLALFDNWDMYSKSIETSKNATGALQRQQDIYMESMEAHLQQLQAAGEGVYNALFNAEDVNPIIDSLTGVTNLFKNFIDAIGGAQGSLLLLGNIATKIFNKQIASSLATMVTNFQGAKNNANQLRAEMEILAQYENANINDKRTQDLINMKRQILDYDKIITDEERNQANEIIRQTNELYKQQDLLEKKKSQIQDVAFRYTGSEINLSNQQDRETLIQDIEGDINDFSRRLKTSLSGSKDNQNTLSSSIAEFEQLRKTLKNTQESQKAYHQSVLNVNEQIKFQRRDIGNLINTHKLSSEQQNKLIKSVQDYKQALQQSGTEGIKNAQVIAKAKDMHTAYIQVLKELIKDGKISVEALKGLKAEMDSINGAAETGERVFNEFTNAIDLRSRINQVISFANSLGSLSMVISSIGRIPDILGDENLSSLEKATQLISIFAMTVPSAISAFNALGVAFGKTGSIADVFNAKQALNIALSKAGIEVSKENTAQMAIENMVKTVRTGLQDKENQSEEENILVTKLKTASQKEAIAILGAMSVEELMKIGLTEADAKAMIAAKAKQDAWNASMLASPWTWVALAIAAVVAGIALYTKSVHEANKAQIKEHQTAIDELKAKRQEVEENKKLVKSYQELKNAFDQGKYTKQEMYDKTLELCGAYSNEINMLDLLEGRYDKVGEAIKRARLAEIEDLSKNSDEIMQHYQDMLTPYKTENAQMKTKRFDLLDSAFDVGSFTSPLGSIWGLGSVATQKISSAVDKTKGSFSKIQEGQTTLTLNAGTGGKDEAEILSILEGSSVFQGINHKVTGLGKGAYEIGLNRDISTPEEFASTYREIEQTYRHMAETLDEETKEQSETYHALYEWLENNKEFVENVEAEQRTKTELKTEKAIYDANFDKEGLVYSDYEKLREEVYFETLYSKEVSKEEAEKSGWYREKDGKYYTMYDGATRENVNELVDQKLREVTVTGDQWIALDQLHNNLVERFGEDQSEAISAMMSNMNSADLQALLTLNIDEVESLEQLGIYIERAQYLADRNKIQIGFEITQTSLDALMEGKELTEEQIKDLEAQFPELSAIWDKNSRAYLETLQQIREEQESALSDTYIKERAFNWEQLNDAIKNYEENFEDFEKGEFPTPRINSAADYQQYQENKENYIKLDKIEDLRQLKEDFENFFTSEYEFQISVTDDILSDIDNVISKAESAQKAISMIGDGFKLSAQDSKELFEIFPELAQDAEVLADGTLQLNQQVVTDVLKGYGLEIDADKEKTISMIQNRIAELEMHRADLQKKLEYIKGTAATEINYNEIIGENQEQWAAYESQLSEDTSENQVKNSAASATAMIEHWAAVEQAAIDYAKTAADAASGKVTGPRISADNYKIKTEVETSAEVTGTEEVSQNVEEEAEKRKQELINFIQNLIDSDTEQIADLTSGLGMMLSEISEIELTKSKDIDLLDDVIDRYHDINIQLEQINRQLKRLQSTREHLIGKALIKSYNEEIKLLQKQIKLSKEKQKIQLEEAKELKGQLLTFGVTFNDDNTVANYAEIMGKYIKKVNSAKASGNEDAAKAAEEEYEYFKKNFERYETLVNSEMPDLVDEITEMGYQKISQKIERFNTTLQVELDTRQAKRDWKDFLKEMTVTDTDYAGQASYLKSDTSSKLKDLESTQKAFEKSNKALENGIALATGAANSANTKSRYYDAETGVFDGAAAQEATQNYLTSLTDLSLEIKENMTSLGQTFLDTLDQANEKIQDALDGYDDINNALNHGIKLQQLFNGEDDYAGMADYYADIVTNTGDQIKLLSQNRDRLANEMVKYRQDVESAEQALEDAKKSGDTYAIAVAQNNYDLAKQALDSTYDAWVSTTENLYSTIETQYENLKNQYLNDVNKILDEITKKFTGGSSLSYLSDEWDLINKSADKYLDTVNSTYEVQTLEGKYLKSISNTTSISTQKKLNKVMDEELESLREKDKLTQYDIDRANKKYELTLKQIALEEAQNNKSTMRLRRDAQGNYSYQYVADEDAVSDAEQEVAAAENDLYNFDKEQYQSTLDEALTLYTEWQQKLAEAAAINDPEERAKKEEMINKYYQDMIYQTVSDNTTAQQNLQSSAFDALSGMYATNLINFEAMTDGMFGDFSKFTIEDMPSLLSQMVAGYDGSIQQMVNAMGNEEEGFIALSNKAFTNLTDSAETFDSSISTLRSNLEENGGAIRDDINKTKLLIDETKDAAEDLVSSLSIVVGDQYETVRDGLTKLGDKYTEVGGQIETARKNAQNLLSTLNTLNGVEENPEIPTIDADPTKVPTFGNSGKTNPSRVPDLTTGDNDGKIITKKYKGEISPFSLQNSGAFGEYFYEYSPVYLEDTKSGIAKEESRKGVINSMRGEEFTLTPTYTSSMGSLYMLSPKIFEKTMFIHQKDLDRFDTGGYTGEWGAEGRMAMLHEKEIVLNKMDTENILNAVSIVRGLDNMMSKLGATFLSGMTSLKIPNIISTENNNSSAQTVNITAKFPDVTSAAEIEKALKNLVNIASQRAQSVK